MTELDFSVLRMHRDKHRADCRFIYCGDVHAGTIAKATTVNAQSERCWSVGFHCRGANPGDFKGSTSVSLESARRDCLPAWLKCAQARTPEDFEEWRDNRDHTAWKYRMHDLGLPLPTQRPDGISLVVSAASRSPTPILAITSAHHIEECRNEDDD